MSWLKRLFGFEQGDAPVSTDSPKDESSDQDQKQERSAGDTVAPERVGLHGEYDQSGLAKRVAAAFDADSEIDDIETVYVAQTGSTVVLKGKAPNNEIVSKMVSVARGVSGATNVDSSQVDIG